MRFGGRGPFGRDEGEGKEVGVEREERDEEEREERTGANEEEGGVWCDWTV